MCKLVVGALAQKMGREGLQLSPAMFDRGRQYSAEDTNADIYLLQIFGVLLLLRSGRCHSHRWHKGLIHCGLLLSGRHVMYQIGYEAILLLTPSAACENLTKHHEPQG